MDEYVVVFEGDEYDFRGVCTNNSADSIFNLEAAICTKEVFSHKCPILKYNIYKLTRVEE